MTTPQPDFGPVTYAETPPYAPYPPLDHTADQPPRPTKRGVGAGTVVGLVAAAGLIAVTAGTIGGGVGYVIARETVPAAATTTTRLWSTPSWHPRAARLPTWPNATT